MLNNIFLFNWEEKYLLNKEIIRRKENFKEKFWSDSIFSFNSENFDIWQIKQTIFSWWLFVSKKLIIITWLPTDSDTSNKIPAPITEQFTDEFIGRQWEIPADSLLIFISYKPDKRGKLYKFLEKNANIKSFNKLSWIELKNFVKNELEWLTIDYDTTDYLIIKVWNNLYNIVSECNKLKTWCEITRTKEINNDMINLVNFWQTETNWFAFFDNFFDKQNQNLKIIDQIQEEGVNWNLFMWTLYRWLRLYIYVLDLYSQGITDSKTIASMTKQHPFAISKNLKNIDKIKWKEKEIKKFYKDLIVLDSKIKWWRLPDSYFRLWIKKMILKI